MRVLAGTTGEPRWEPTSAADLLKLVADIDGPIGRDAQRLFLAACKVDAAHHDGYVSVNRVRVLVSASGADIPPRRYSAMWATNTGRGKPMVKVSKWEVCRGSTSGNDGRPFTVRRWVGPNSNDGHASGGVPA